MKHSFKPLQIPIFIFGVLLPHLEIFRSNYYILFDYEIVHFMRFSISYLIFISLFTYVLNILLVKNFKKSSLYSISLSFYFFNYVFISNSFYKLFEINYSGALFWLSTLLLIFFIINKYFEIIYNFVIILIISQLIFTSFTIFSFNFEDKEYAEPEVNFIKKPDVYFFLIDNLATEQNLKTTFNRNYNFINNLGNKSKDYKMYEESISSYGRTLASVASILDNEYKLSGQFSGEDNFWNLVNEKLDSQNTLVEKIFISNGYEIVKYGSAFSCIDTENITCYRELYEGLNTVTNIMLQETPLNVLSNLRKLNLNRIFVEETIQLLDSMFEVECSTVFCGDPNLNSFVIDTNKPTLHLIHLVNSHGPFFVDSKCNKLKEIIWDSNVFILKKEYLDSIDCFKMQMQLFVNQIEDDTLVIFQSDHGPEEEDFKNIYNPTIEDLNKIKLRYEIFSISNIEKFCFNVKNDFGGVNTFGYVLNCLTGLEKFNTETFSYYVDYENYLVSDITYILKD